MQQDYIVVDTRRGGGSLEQLMALVLEGYEIVPPDGLVVFAPAPKRIRSSKRFEVVGAPAPQAPDHVDVDVQPPDDQ